MKIVFFSHPDSSKHQSMSRFTRLLAEGMKERGHQVAVWSPEDFFFKISAPQILKKWLGYIDQYVVFPAHVKKQIEKCDANTLFVFTDHSLGMWVPLVIGRPHVIHCHDFLAQQSALGKISENLTGWTGRQYQRLIRKGFSKGRNFISVSMHTKEQLRIFVPSEVIFSEVVYNGVNKVFTPYPRCLARLLMVAKTNLNLAKGYILHVGGNQWYKNRDGVLEIYEAWRSYENLSLPLLLIGEKPSMELVKKVQSSNYRNDIHWLPGMDDEYVHLAYSGASVFLFPSIYEGFGWPIVEAMASGCPVITTGNAPMTEVAGDAAFLIDRRSGNDEEWAQNAAKVVSQVLNLKSNQKMAVINKGFINAERFDLSNSLNQIELYYKKALLANKIKNMKDGQNQNVEL